MSSLNAPRPSVVVSPARFVHALVQPTYRYRYIYHHIASTVVYSHRYAPLLAHNSHEYTHTHSYAEHWLNGLKSKVVFDSHTRRRRRRRAENVGSYTCVRAVFVCGGPGGRAHTLLVCVCVCVCTLSAHGLWTERRRRRPRARCVMFT